MLDPKNACLPNPNQQEPAHIPPLSGADTRLKWETVYDKDESLALSLLSTYIFIIFYQ